MIEQAKRDGAVDVYGFVSEMRNQRMKMVQVEVSIENNVLQDASCKFYDLKSADVQRSLKS